MTIPTRVLHLVANEVKGLSVEDIHPSTELHTMGDHLKFYEILMSAEDHFDVEFSDAEAESIKTVQNLIDFIAGKIGVEA